MANQTWRETANECLRYARVRIISSDDTFDDDTKLSDPQQAAKYFVKLFHRMLGLRATQHYAQRRIPLNIDESTPEWPIDVGVNPESIDFESWRNITAGSATFGKLEVWDQQAFRNNYKDPSLINSGSPRAVVILPIERTDLSPVRRVRIVPNPDKQYSLEFIAKVNAYELKQASDPVIFPPEYNHALELFSWAQLETALGEGKEGSLYALADRAVREVRLAAGRPADIRRAVRTIGSIRRGRRDRIWWRLV